MPARPHACSSEHEARGEAGRASEAAQCYVVVGAQMQHGVAATDRRTGDQLSGIGDPVAVEVGGNLQNIGAGVKIGDHVVAGMDVVENKRIRLAGGAIIVVSGAVDEGVGSGSAEHIVVAGAGVDYM